MASTAVFTPNPNLQQLKRLTDRFCRAFLTKRADRHGNRPAHCPAQRLPGQEAGGFNISGNTNSEQVRA